MGTHHVMIVAPEYQMWHDTGPRDPQTLNIIQII
jgi:hypothetical protein